MNLTTIKMLQSIDVNKIDVFSKMAFEIRVNMGFCTCSFPNLICAKNMSVTISISHISKNISGVTFTKAMYTRFDLNLTMY